MKNLNPLEKDIEKRVCEFAKSLRILHYKFTSPQRRSVPDRVFILPEGKGVFWIEFKRRGEKSTPAQVIEQDKIRKQGAAVFVVDNEDHGRCVISDMYHQVPGLVGLPRPSVEDPCF